MKLVLDAEWYTPEGKDVVHGAEYLHCIVTEDIDTGEVNKFYGQDYKEPFTELLRKAEAIICHNVINADLHVFKKLLGIGFKISPSMEVAGDSIKIIDTLTMSRRLWPDRPMPKSCPKSVYNPVTKKNDTIGAHGLMAWGVRVGAGKPIVHDWRDQPLDVYLHRCQEDVTINKLTYFKLLEELQR